jgi:hypothetical protein
LKRPPAPAHFTGGYQSEVHDQNICLKTFYEFVLQRLTGGEEDEDNMAKAAAVYLLDKGLDLRDKGGSYNHAQHYIQSKFFGLPSHTQFVEAGVKEAKVVSQSDRSEQLRSAYAISRSARVGNLGTLREMSSTQRIEALMKSAQDHCKTHSALRDTVEDYSKEVEAIVASMRKESFKKERIGRLQEEAIAKGNKNRTKNAIQKQRGVDKTLVDQGMVSYGRLKKNFHMKDLEVELLHRGCTPEEVKAMTGIRERTKRLKAMEITRGNTNEKAFKPLSAAPFQIA